MASAVTSANCRLCNDGIFLCDPVKLEAAKRLQASPVYSPALRYVQGSTLRKKRSSDPVSAVRAWATTASVESQEMDDKVEKKNSCITRAGLRLQVGHRDGGSRVAVFGFQTNNTANTGVVGSNQV